jgi:hypothetical protein
MVHRNSTASIGGLAIAKPSLVTFILALDRLRFKRHGFMVQI